MVPDDAFPLNEYIMKSFGGKSQARKQRIYNYRLSRARRVVENAFGILSARFRIFRAPITTTVANVQKIILAACVLYNFLCSNKEYIMPGNLDTEDLQNHCVHLGDWRKEPTKNLIP